MIEEETKEVTKKDALKLLEEGGDSTIEKEQKKPFPYSSLIWYVGGYLVHVIIFIPIVILTAIIPEINTNSTFYLHAFERNNFFIMDDYVYFRILICFNDKFKVREKPSFQIKERVSL
jgi:hypothetical protein